MKMKKNFAFLMVLALAALMASAGLASSAPAGCGDACASYEACVGGGCIDCRGVPDRYDQCDGATTAAPKIGSGDLRNFDANQVQVSINENDTCEDGECGPRKGVLMSDGEGNYRFAPMTDAVQEVSIEDSPASFTCGSDSFTINQGGSGNSGAGQLAVGGGSGGCTSDLDCPSGQTCRGASQDTKGVCIDDDDGSSSGSGGVTNNGSSRSDQGQQRRGFLGIEGLFTANN